MSALLSSPSTEVTPADRTSHHQQPEAPGHPAIADDQTLRTIWHLTHLTNAMTSSLSVYISFEALARDRYTRGKFRDAPGNYKVAFHHHILTLNAIVLDLFYCYNLLRNATSHESLLAYGGYRSLLGAAVVGSDCVGLYKTFAPSFDPSGQTEAEMPCREVIEQLKDAHAKLINLRNGDPSEGITGWKDCWDEVNGQAVE